MFNTSKKTAIALVAFFAMNGIIASAQAGSVTGDHIKKGAQTTASRVLTTPESNSTNPMTDSSSVGRVKAEFRNKDMIPSIQSQTPIEHNYKAQKVDLAAPVVTPTATPIAAPSVIPDAPCGTVATNPNPEVVASSTTC
jgi:hypothetical protein